MTPLLQGSAVRKRSCERGSVAVEYTIILVLVAVGCACATAALGPPLVRMYLARETWLLLAFP